MAPVVDRKHYKEESQDKRTWKVEVEIVDCQKVKAEMVDHKVEWVSTIKFDDLSCRSLGEKIPRDGFFRLRGIL